MRILGGRTPRTTPSKSASGSNAKGLKVLIYLKYIVCSIDVPFNILQMEDTFYCPEEVTMPSGKIVDKIPPGYRPFIWTNAGGLRHEAEEVRRCIRNGE